jgi:hypothetical protein
MQRETISFIKFTHKLKIIQYIQVTNLEHIKFVMIQYLTSYMR